MFRVNLAQAGSMFRIQTRRVKRAGLKEESVSVKAMIMGVSAIGVALTLCMLTMTKEVAAQSAEPYSPITIVSGSIDGSNKRFVSDIESVVRTKSGMAMAPIFGLGSAQDVMNLIYTRQVEVGMIHADVLNAAKRQRKLYPDVEKYIRLISWISHDEIHIIAGRGIRDVSQLANKVVNFGPGTERIVSTPYMLFEALNIPVHRVALSQADAFKRIKSGEIAATVIAAAKPHATVARLSAEDGLHILPIKMTDRLGSSYVANQIRHADYPGLVEKGQTIDTVTVASVLITSNWPKNHRRYRKLAAFAKTLFANAKTLKDKKYHPKWRDANFAKDLEGWTRFAPAEALLAGNGPVRQASEADRRQFEEFLALSGQGEGLDASTVDQMFSQFLTWRKQQAQ